MVVDTSVLVAILQDEPQREALPNALLAAERCRVAAVTLVEAGVVMQARYGDIGADRLDRFLAVIRADVVPVTAAQAAAAREAFRRFGKGRHPAALNLGDCFAYALATAIDEPLLFIGDDFAQTDVRIAPI